MLMLVFAIVPGKGADVCHKRTIANDYLVDLL